MKTKTMRKRRNTGISSKGKIWLRKRRTRMRMKRLIRGSRNTNRRYSNNKMTMTKKILITRSHCHMTCHYNETWARML